MVVYELCITEHMVSERGSELSMLSLRVSASSMVLDCLFWVSDLDFIQYFGVGDSLVVLFELFSCT